MFSITSNQVTINNPSIVTFFNKYQSNSIFLSHFEHIIGSLCTTIDTFGLPGSSSTHNVPILANNSTLEHILENSVSNVAENILSKLSNKFNNFGHADTSNHTSNDSLFTLLSQTSLFRNGYTINKVNDIKNGCNIRVQHEKLPDIHIQSYTHVKDIVSKTDLESFEKYLLELDTNGIFVSAHTNIAGKGSIDIFQLPNAKFIIYLSNNLYDCDVIIDMIFLLFKLDRIISTNQYNHTLTPINIFKIKHIIQTFDSKINDIKNNLKSVISTLNTITFSTIEQILTNQFNDDTSAIHHNISCDVCGFIPKNHTGLVAHKRKCNKINTPSTKTIDST
jgi:hypothetical protein